MMKVPHVILQQRYCNEWMKQKSNARCKCPATSSTYWHQTYCSLPLNVCMMNQWCLSVGVSAGWHTYSNLVFHHSDVSPVAALISLPETKKQTKDRHLQMQSFGLFPWWMINVWLYSPDSKIIMETWCSCGTTSDPCMKDGHYCYSIQSPRHRQDRLCP